MSDFKYACPVCGQHIKCDSSQAGTQMQCPTCFQMIIVPQPPAGEQKLILTGSQVGERPLPKAPEANPDPAPPVKSFSGVGAVIIILMCIAAAVTFVYRGTIFKRPGPKPPAQVAFHAPTNQPPPKPKIVAPPASDTNWTLNLKDITIPELKAAGRINGQDFVCQRAFFANGILTLRDGDMGAAINFSGTMAQALAGKKFNVATNATAAVRVTLHWKDEGQNVRKAFTNDYAMVLNFDPMTNSRIAGKIYLCTPDGPKSYVAGTFDAEVRKPKNQ